MVGRLHDEGANADAVLVLRVIDELERLSKLYYPPESCLPKRGG